MALEFSLTNEPPHQDVSFVEESLYEFNASTTGLRDGERLAIFVRDSGGRLVAGLNGWSWGGCCKVNELWVHRELRKQGVGSRLLEMAETEARRRGCQQMVLSTYSFQAPEFYPRHGYEQIAVVEDVPRGHQELVFRKDLEVAGD